MSKQAHDIWKVKLDLIPRNANEVLVSHEHIDMVIPGAEEKVYNREKMKAKDTAGKCATSKRKTQSQYVKDLINACISVDKPQSRQPRVLPIDMDQRIKRLLSGQY